MFTCVWVIDNIVKLQLTQMAKSHKLARHSAGSGAGAGAGASAGAQPCLENPGLRHVDSPGGHSSN